MQGVNKDIPVLSFLQHYGAPTPLLDWTHYDIIALYFATEKIRNVQERGIGNYFSIYELQYTGKAGPQNYFNVDEVIENYNLFTGFSKQELDRFKTGIKGKYNFEPSYKYINSNYNTYENLEKQPDNSGPEVLLWVISDFLFDILNDKNANKFALYSNRNFNAQQQLGTFTFSPSPMDPFEKVYNDKAIKIESSSGSTHPFPRIKCYDIHKSLAVYIQQRLKSMGINNSYIYSEKEKKEAELIAANAYKSVLTSRE